eukprot:3462895-Pleurochrysis_carterae.AAC.1
MIRLILPRRGGANIMIRLIPPHRGVANVMIRLIPPHRGGADVMIRLILPRRGGVINARPLTGARLDTARHSPLRMRPRQPIVLPQGGLQTNVAAEVAQLKQAQSRQIEASDPAELGAGADTVRRDRHGRKLEGLNAMLEMERAGDGAAKPVKPARSLCPLPNSFPFRYCHASVILQSVPSRLMLLLMLRCACLSADCCSTLLLKSVHILCIPSRSGRLLCRYGVQVSRSSAARRSSGSMSGSGRISPLRSMRTSAPCQAAAHALAHFAWKASFAIEQALLQRKCELHMTCIWVIAERDASKRAIERWGDPMAGRLALDKVRCMRPDAMNNALCTRAGPSCSA